MTRRNNLISALLFAGVILCASAPRSFAQAGSTDPIRVESNQVLVPTVIIDKEREAQFQHKSPEILQRAIATKNIHLLEDSVEAVTIPDLTAKEIHLSEDGIEQAIQNVTSEPSLYWNFRDNVGYHTEFTGQGGGVWSGPLWPPGRVAEIAMPHYLIAYAPPPSAEGSCHKIKVKVDRPNALVYARNEYCNTKHSPADPLNGTIFGKQMEGELASPRKNKIDLTLLAVAFDAEEDTARVHLALEFPPDSLRANSKTKGVLGIVYEKDGTLAARFSDLFDGREGPIRYERQLDLPPGEYDLRVVLSDGEKFRRTQVPLIVDSYDRKQLEISAIALCRRFQEVSSGSQEFPAKLPGRWTNARPGKYERLVSRGIEFKPTGNTHFKRGEPLYAYFEVYESLLDEQSSTTIEANLRIVNVKTGEVNANIQHGTITLYTKADNPVTPVSWQIGISKLPKGSYRVEVQATDSMGKGTAWRTANFMVE